MAVDSTTITVGKNLLPWALYHGERSGIKLHMSYTIRTAMPLQAVETIGSKNDSPIGIELEDKRYIFIADCAYFSIEKVDRYEKTVQAFVIRLKENIRLNRKKSLKRTPVQGSNILADFTCTLGTPQKQTKTRHRVVKFTDYKGSVVRVITTLREANAEEIAGMYKER